MAAIIAFALVALMGIVIAAIIVGEKTKTEQLKACVSTPGNEWIRETRGYECRTAE